MADEITPELMQEYKQFRARGGKTSLRAWSELRRKMASDPRHRQRMAVKNARARPAGNGTGNGGSIDPVGPVQSGSGSGGASASGTSGRNPTGATGVATQLFPGTDGIDKPRIEPTEPVGARLRPVGQMPADKDPRGGSIDPVGPAQESVGPGDKSLATRPVAASVKPAPGRPPQQSGPRNKSGNAPSNNTTSGGGGPVTIDQVRAFADYLRSHDLSQYDAETQARVVRQLQAADRQIGTGVVDLAELGVDPSFTSDSFAQALSNSATTRSGGPVKPGQAGQSGAGQGGTTSNNAPTPASNNAPVADAAEGEDAQTGRMQEVRERAQRWSDRMAEMEQAVIAGEMSPTEFMRENQRFEAFMAAAESGDYEAAMAADNPFDAGPGGANGAPRRDLAEVNAERQRVGLRPISQEVYDLMPERGAQQAGYAYGSGGGMMLSGEYANERSLSSQPRMSQIIAGARGDPAEIQRRLQSLGATDVIDDVSGMTDEQLQGHRYADAIRQWNAGSAQRNPQAAAPNAMAPGTHAAPTPAVPPVAGPNNTGERQDSAPGKPGGSQQDQTVKPGAQASANPNDKIGTSGAPAPAAAPVSASQPTAAPQPADQILSMDEYQRQMQGPTTGQGPTGVPGRPVGRGMPATRPPDLRPQGVRSYMEARAATAPTSPAIEMPGRSDDRLQKPEGTPKPTPNAQPPGGKIGLPSPSAVMQAARGVVNTGVDAVQSGLSALGAGARGVMDRITGGSSPSTTPQQAAANVQGQPQPPGRTGGGGGNFNANGGLNSAGQAAFTGAQIAQNQARTRAQAIAAMQSARTR